MQLSQAQPSFSKRIFSTVPTERFYGMTIDDFNGDGIKDVAAVNQVNQNLSVLTGTGMGNFNGKSDFLVGSGLLSVSSGDLNNDGKIDIVTSGSTNTGSRIFVLTNNGIGQFNSIKTFLGFAAGQISIGDINGDNMPDLGVNFVLTNTGTGSFNLINTNNMGGGFRPSKFADFNGDGILDLAYTSVSGTNSSIIILTNTGFGVFTIVNRNLLPTIPVRMLWNDINNDGKPDLVITGQQNILLVFSVALNNGNGIYNSFINYTIGGGNNNVDLGDFDNDGDLDLVSASGNILLNDGTGAFGLPINVLNESVSNGLAASDLNGDGRIDLVFGVHGGIAVLINQNLQTISGFNAGNLVYGSQTTFPITSSSGFPIQYISSDNAVLSFSGNNAIINLTTKYL